MVTRNRIYCGFVNIQSVGNRTVELRELLNEGKLDVLAIGETWLDKYDCAKIKEMTPMTHTFMHIPRGHKRGGGVGLFISNRFTRIKLFDTQRFSTFEHMQLNLMLGHNQVLTFIVVYRLSDTNKNLFIEEFTIYLVSLDRTHNRIYINGDFNLWVDDDQDRYARKFLNLMASHHFVNEVSGGTSRFGHTLDLVFGVSDVGKILELNVDHDFSISSSHKMITYTINVKKS